MIKSLAVLIFSIATAALGGVLGVNLFASEVSLASAPVGTLVGLAAGLALGTAFAVSDGSTRNIITLLLPSVCTSGALIGMFVHVNEYEYPYGGASLGAVSGLLVAAVIALALAA